jgi:predicted ferric reductase
MKDDPLDSLEANPPVVSLHTLFIVLLGILSGVLLATRLLPALLPGLTTSLLGEAPKAFWYLSRGSAMTAYLLLWLSMVFGLLITNRMARLWPGGPAAVDLHQFISLLGIGFALFHGLILMGDQYIQFSLAQIFVPFASQAYRPFAVGIGQVGFYLWAIVAFSFYVRRKIGSKTWRLVHFASFLAFAAALFHGMTSGTDTGSIWAILLYSASGIILLFLILYRILIAGDKEHHRPRKLIKKPSPDRLSNPTG